MKTILRAWVVAAVMLLGLPAPAFADSESPFAGRWRTIDHFDGSRIYLTIAGPRYGRFGILWAESYFSFCGGPAGIAFGRGEPDPDDPEILQANMRLWCFFTGDSVRWQQEWRYLPEHDVLTSQDDVGVVTTWARIGEPLVSVLDLRVNYGDGWVESFYEAGHTVRVTVRQGEDGPVKATAEVETAPRDQWGGDSGFQTQPEDWVPAPPDIDSGDWVYADVSNGALAQTRIGEITGEINLENDSITGTIDAPWFDAGQEIEVECHPWGASEDTPTKYDNIFPDGTDTYTCEWDASTEWDVQAGQPIGVSYSGENRHWVANTFTVPNPLIVASVVGDFFWVDGFQIGETLDFFIYDNENRTLELWHGSTENYDGEIFNVNPEDHGVDLTEGQLIVVSDELDEDTLVLELITMDVFDLHLDYMVGTAPPDRSVRVTAGFGPDPSERRVIETISDADGDWTANFAEVDPPVDIEEEWRPWSFASIFDDDGDANEAGAPPPPPNPLFTVFPDGEGLDGYDWPDGAEVTASVAGKPECDFAQTSFSGFFNVGFPEGCDVKVLDEVTLTDGATIRTHTVQNLAVTSVDEAANTVMGTADAGAEIHLWVHEFFDESEMQATATGDGNWQADFNSRGFDLMERMCGRSEIRDEVGNSTAHDWCVPDPHVTVFPEWDAVELWDWPIGSTVHLTIDDPGTPNGPDFEGDFIMEAADWDPSQGFLWVDVSGQHDIQAGDEVTASDGTTPRMHTVRNLVITGADADENTVMGTAGDGDEVHLSIYDFGEIQFSVIVDGGTWSADFDLIDIDLVEGMCGQAAIHDEEENFTIVEWCVDPPPEIWIAAYAFDIDAGSWTEGAHSYYFEFSYSEPEPGSGTLAEIAFNVSNTAAEYPGYVLLRPLFGRLIANIDGACTTVTEIQPSQLTRFLFGWVTDIPMTQDDALAHFDSLQVWANADVSTFELNRQEVLTSADTDWPSYVCSFTLPVP